MAFELPHLEILGLIVVPALAAVAAALLGSERRPAIRWIAVVASCLTLLVAVSLTARFMHLTMTGAREPAAGRGGPERRDAAGKFVIYSLAGRLVTVVAVIGVVIACYDKSPTGEMTFSIPRLVEMVHSQLASSNPEVQAYWRHLQSFVFIALMAG